jgi:hypothetical protein
MKADSLWRWRMAALFVMKMRVLGRKSYPSHTIRPADRDFGADGEYNLFREGI